MTRESRGPTRRVRQLIDAGLVPNELLAAASHEADLLAHPYVGLEHLELARLRLAGKPEERESLRRPFALVSDAAGGVREVHGQLCAEPVSRQPKPREGMPLTKTARGDR